MIDDNVKDEYYIIYDYVHGKDFLTHIQHNGYPDIKVTRIIIFKLLNIVKVFHISIRVWYMEWNKLMLIVYVYIVSTP